MLRNFHLTALVRQRDASALLHIPLHRELQRTLAATWDEQLNEFLSESAEIHFDAGYTPSEHERFRLSGFTLPAPMDDTDSATVDRHDRIDRHEDILTSLKALVAFCRDARGTELMLFQSFSRSHVVKPGRFLFLEGNTYQTTDRPGLSLGNELTAVYFPAQRKLLFRNFRAANTFLPLSDFYEEASEEQIQEVLGHALLAPEDAVALAVDANQWFRKRFAMLRDSGVLDHYSAKQIKQRSTGYDVDIRISRGRIVFPASKPAAKKLLQFLNEELFRGPITETLYETNSKRQAD